MGGGKALRDDQRVLTPKGFVKISSLKVGDEVITPNNTITKVIGVYPQGVVDLFNVEMLDGKSVITCKDHLWECWKAGQPNNRRELTTEALIEKISKANWLIPHTSPLDLCTDVELPIDPYVLGVVLGDGNFSQKHCSITTSDEEVLTFFEEAGYEVTKWKGDDYTYGVKGLITEISKLGLKGLTSKHKYIPEIYKTADIDSRFSLIQGLMDSDGYVSKDGKLQFYTSSLQLAEDFQEVIRSLGGSATLTEKWVKYNGDKVLSYSVYIKFVDGGKLVRLSRKKCRTKVSKAHVGCRIKSITPVAPGHATCISVADEGKLFVTEDYIVTHNTWSILADNLQGIHDPAYFSVFFRSTTTEIDQGLWPEAKLMYEPFLKDKDGHWMGKAKIHEQNKTITFPSGARSTFSYMERDAHADKWYGAEITKIYFDGIVA